VYDGAVVVQERDGNNIPRVTYTRGLDLAGSLSGAGGIGGLLARTDNSSYTVSPGMSHAYYQADGMGNVTCMVNSNQAVVAKYLYDGFGNQLAKSGQLADANTYRASSQEYFSTSGLVGYSRRFYDSNLQRWLNRDPIGEAGGINLYQFVGNSPINNVDPFGLTDTIPYVVYPDSFIGPLPPGGVRESYDRFRQQAESNGLQPSLLGEILLPGGGVFMSGGASRCGAKALAEAAARRSAEEAARQVATQAALKTAIEMRDSAGTALSVAIDARRAAEEAVRTANASWEYVAEQFGKGSVEYFQATQDALRADANLAYARATAARAAENFRIASEAALKVR
jgi:RHS repeat-associated protein